MAEFKVGDKVTWTSQAAGMGRVKIGTVIEVVPAHSDPKARGDFGWHRDHTSYVVRAVAEGRATRRTTVYWPRVSALRLASGSDASEIGPGGGK